MVVHRGEWSANPKSEIRNSAGWAGGIPNSEFRIPNSIRKPWSVLVYHGAMKVYTRTGDDGKTSLISGGRVRKDDLRVEAYGTVDELSSFVGLLRCEPVPDDVAQHLVDVQRSLFAVGAFLADPEGRMGHDPGSWEVGQLESWIDAMDSELPELQAFILAGGCRGAAAAHVARAVCRRAERRVTTLAATEAGAPEGVLRYLNRLSDALFTLARFLNVRSGNSETEWHPDPKPCQRQGGN